MTDAPKHGGQAFPRAGTIWTDMEGRQTGDAPEPGMTLRDWFAGMFAAQMVTTPDWNLNGRDCLAEDAYAFADAMLAEREKPHD